jgi:hypothetical protein
MCDTAVEDVADECDAQSRDLSELGLQRQQIEQRLRRMRVPPVARIDHVTVERLRETIRKPRFRMPRNDHAHAHRAERDRRIRYGFALPEARRAWRKRDDVGPDALFGDRERRERSRTRFEEEINDANVA